MSLKVAFVIHDQVGDPGGVASWLIDLLPELRRRGIDARVLVFRQTEADGGLIQSLRALSVPMDINSHQLPFPERVRWLVDSLHAFMPAVVVPNYLISGYAAGANLHRLGIKTIAVMHTDDAMYRALRAACFGGAAEFPLSAAVCVSKVLTDEWRSSAPAGIPVHNIPYGVPAALGIAKPPGATLRLAYVGRLVEAQKRIGDVARALCRAVAQCPGVEADIIGDGIDRPVVEAVLAENGNPSAIRLLGALPVTEVRGLLPQYHALVLLSDYEGLPVCLLEAMTCGVVPICSAMRSGIDEIVHDRETGIIVKDRADDFLRAVTELKEAPALWQHLSQAAREIAAPYSSTRCADRWEQVIREVAGQQRVKPVGTAPRRLRMPRWHPDYSWEYPRPIPLGERLKARLRPYFGPAKRFFSRLIS